MAVQINTAFVVDIIIALLSRSVTVSCSHPVLRVPEKLDVLTNTRSFKTNMSVKIHLLYGEILKDEQMTFIK